jgi:DNA end-binding protein Ku
MAAVWTGTLSFGLVAIPVRLFPATQPKDVRFHLVDPETGRRIRYKRVVDEGPPDWEPTPARVPDAGELARGPSGRSVEEEPFSPEPERSAAPTPREVEVSYRDLDRGYEVEDGRFVTLRAEEIERVRPSRSRSIDIEDFVELDDIDPVYFEKSYYLVPQNGGEKPYELLLRAMQRAHRVAIGRFVLRTKPHLVAIRPLDDALGLETLFFSDEVRAASGFVSGLEAFEPSERELTIAEELIETLKTDWVPENYADEYREALLRMVSERAPQSEESEEAVASTPNVERLMEALKASVEAAKRSQVEAKKRTHSRKTG